MTMRQWNVFIIRLNMNILTCIPLNQLTNWIKGFYTLVIQFSLTRSCGYSKITKSGRRVWIRMTILLPDGCLYFTVKGSAM